MADPVFSPDGQWVWNGDDWVPALPSNPPPQLPPPSLGKPIPARHDPILAPLSSETYVPPVLPPKTMPPGYPASANSLSKVSKSKELAKTNENLKEKQHFEDYIPGWFLAIIFFGFLILGFGFDIPTKTDNLEYEHIEVQVYDNDWWCGSNIDGYCHQISFLINNENVFWSFNPDEGNWTVSTRDGFTVRPSNADVNNREASPQQIVRYDLEFPVSQNDRIVRLTWTSGDLEFSADLPTY